jgi:hypothetical protein
MHNSQPSNVVTGPGEIPAHDPVLKPKHYAGKTLEVIDVIERLRCGAHMGNVIKYILRAPHKGNVQDLQKAIWYLNRAATVHTGPLRTELWVQAPYGADVISEEFGVSDDVIRAYTAVVIAIDRGHDFLIRRGRLQDAIHYIEAEISSLQTGSGGAG